MSTIQDVCKCVSTYDAHNYRVSKKQCRSENMWFQQAFVFWKLNTFTNRVKLVYHPKFELNIGVKMTAENGVILNLKF